MNQFRRTPATSGRPAPSGRSVSQAQLERVLDEQVQVWQEQVGRPSATVLDVGGGTGTMATHLAELGHTVTVIDPSPDALASLERRAAEAGVGDRVVGRQGDAGDIAALVGDRTVDIVLCHRVLDVVDHPAEALAAMAASLRSDGRISLLVPGRRAAVLGHAIGGQLDAAVQALADPRRFDLEQVVALFDTVGLELMAEHGIAALADLVPEAATESTAARQQLLALEQQISSDPVFRAMAAHLHLTGRPHPDGS